VAKRHVNREYFTGAIIFICILVIILSVVSLQVLEVKVTNIELVDRGLYTVITDNGPINVTQEDVLRIERVYTKAAMTGTPVEQDRIYTIKGLIYISSLDPFFKTGLQLINSVDFEGKTVWIRSNQSEATESQKSWNNLLNANLKTVQPFSYAIGTPPKHISLVFSVLSLQYLALAIGGLALMILIFPMRMGTPIPPQASLQVEPESDASEEVIGVVAK